MTPFGLALWTLLAVLAALAVIAFVVSGVRVIRENQSGLVIKRYGRPLPSGRIIALDGEAGYQARMPVCGGGATKC